MYMVQPSPPGSGKASSCLEGVALVAQRIVSGVALTREFRRNLRTSISRELRRLQEELPISPDDHHILRGLPCTGDEIEELLFDPRLEQLAFVRGAARRDANSGIHEGLKLLILLRRSDRARLR